MPKKQTGYCRPIASHTIQTRVDLKGYSADRPRTRKNLLFGFLGKSQVESAQISMTYLTLSFAIGALLSFPLSSAWTNVISTRPQIHQTRLSTSILNSSDNDEVVEINEEVPARSLSDLLLPNAKCTPTQMSPTSLAYIGDSVFELFVRSRYVWPTRRTTDLQKLVVGRVRGQ